MAIKVFGGLIFLGGKQVRTIVAAKTKKRAAELLKISTYELNTWWSETGNEKELETALSSPETVFCATTSMGYDFKIKS